MTLRAERFFQQTADIADKLSRRICVAGLVVIQAGNKLQDAAARWRTRSL